MQKSLPGMNCRRLVEAAATASVSTLGLPSVRAEVIHPAVEISLSDTVTLRQGRKPKGDSK